MSVGAVTRPPAALHAAIRAVPGAGERRPNYTADDIVTASRAGLIGVVQTAHLFDLVTVDDDALWLLDERASEAASVAVTIESRGAATVRALAARGVDVRVLKGVAVAHLDYEDPIMRPFGDIDLLVRGTDMPCAVEVLRSQGFRRHFDEPYPGYDEHIGKGVAMEDETGTVIDLHRTLALGYYGSRIPVGMLWEPGERMSVADTDVTALPRAARFVHAALHMALAPVRLDRYALDLCAISGGERPIDAAETLACARAWGCSTPLFEAINMTTRRFGEQDVEPELCDRARRFRPTIRDRIMMSTYRGRLASSAMRSFSAAMALPDRAVRRRALRMLMRRRKHHPTA